MENARFGRLRSQFLGKRLVWKTVFAAFAKVSWKTLVFGRLHSQFFAQVSWKTLVLEVWKDRGRARERKGMEKAKGAVTVCAVGRLHQGANVRSLCRWAFAPTLAWVFWCLAVLGAAASGQRLRLREFTFARCGANACLSFFLPPWSNVRSLAGCWALARMLGWFFLASLRYRGGGKWSVTATARIYLCSLRSGRLPAVRDCDCANLRCLALLGAAAGGRNKIARV